MRSAAEPKLEELLLCGSAELEQKGEVFGQVIDIGCISHLWPLWLASMVQEEATGYAITSLGPLYQKMALRQPSFACIQIHDA